MTDLQLAMDLLEVAFPTGVPAGLGALLDPHEIARDLTAFKAAPILPSDRSRARRCYVADVGDAAGWRARCVARWPSHSLAAFFDQVPEHARRMLDTDGLRDVFYLDDLHLVDTAVPLPDGLLLMCETVALPDGERSRLTRHGELPVELLSGPWALRARAVEALGLGGMWGLRWDASGVRSLLLVNEDRFRPGVDPRRAADRVTEAGVDGWDDCRAAAERSGRVAYPDAIEVLADGSWDVTVGICAAEEAAPVAPEEAPVDRDEPSDGGERREL